MSIYNVKDFGAVGNGSTDDTSAIQNVINTATTAGGGTLYFPAGIYIAAGLVMKAGVWLLGEGIGVSVLKLKNSSATDLILTEGFSGLTGGTTRGGPENWGIKGLTLDGNKTNVTSGWVLKIFGSAYQIENVEIQNGKSGGVLSEWGTGGTDMEAQWSSCRIHDNDVIGMDWRGPHDSVFSNLSVFKNLGNGIKTSGNSTSEQFTNTHVWGTEHDIGMNLRNPAYLTNCQVEGATSVNLLFASPGNMNGGAVFGTNTGAEVGIQIGDGTSGTVGGVGVFGVRLFNFSATGKPLNFFASAGSRIDVQLFGGSGTDPTAINGSPATTDYIVVTSNDSLTLSAESRHVQSGRFLHYPPAASTSSFVLKAAGGTADDVNWNSSSGRMEFNNSKTLRFYTGSYTGQTVQINGAGNVDIADPSAANNSLKIAPSANKSSSTSAGGALLIDNSASTGAGMVIYSTQAAPAGRLLVVRANNAAFSQAGIHLDYLGNNHGMTIQHGGTGLASLALSIVSTNTDDTALGVTGQPANRGTIKITHNKPGTADTNASLISLLANGSATAVQGIFFDTETGVTTSGRLLNFRQDGVEKFVVDSAGKIQVQGSQVVSNRITGWGSATGTKARTTFVTDSATTAQVAARLGQLIDDLITHGLIGA